MSICVFLICTVRFSKSYQTKTRRNEFSILIVILKYILIKTLSKGFGTHASVMVIFQKIMTSWASSSMR